MPKLKPSLLVILLATVLALGTLPAAVPAAQAQLAIGSQFNPSNDGGLCSLGFDSSTSEVWVYDCSGSSLGRYASSGTFVSSIPRPGESANDVDIEVATDSFQLGAATVPAHALLFINGETGPAEIYAVDKTAGTNLSTLNANFGVSHVVGGAYHRARQTLFLVQDNVPAAADRNRVAEVHPTTGAVLNTFQVEAAFSVNFGDLEVCNSTGNLLLVSSQETRIAEFSPTGTFVAYHNLPGGVTSLSGIGIDENNGDLWVGGTGGNVWRLTGGPCAAAPTVPGLGARGIIVLACLLTGCGVLWITARRMQSA